MYNYEEFDLAHIPCEYEEDEMINNSSLALSGRGNITERNFCGSPGGINRVRGFEGISPSKKRPNIRRNNATSILSFASNPA